MPDPLLLIGGVDLELKKSLGEKEGAMKTLSAFLNGKGGTVIFGVTPGGKIRGTELADQNLRNLGELFRFFEPGTHVEQTRVAVDGHKHLLLLRVEPVPGESPYTYHARAYIRNGSRTDRMPRNIYEQRLAARDTPSLRWETKVASGVRELAPIVPEVATRTVRAYLKNLQDLGLAENDGKRGLGATWRIRHGGLEVLAKLEAAG